LGLNDFVLVSGFYNGYDQATPQTYALDVRNGSTSSTWRRMDDHPVSAGITHGAFAAVNKLLYICGGYVGGHPGPETSDCFVYNHSQPPGQRKQWSRWPSLPEGRAGGGLIYDKQRRVLLFASGARRPKAGNADAVDYNTTWMYALDRPAAGWVRKADMPYSANHMSYVTVVDPLTARPRHFFLGGQVGENEYTGNVVDNLEWDAAKEVWLRRKSMPMTRGHAASSTRAVGCGFIIAAGSTNENGKTADVSYYDIPTDTWTSVGKLPNSINTPVCDISGGYLYCESGWTGSTWSYRRQIIW
jgi:Kelch motif